MSSRRSRYDSQDNLTQADFHTGHDEAILVLAAPGPQARTHRVDLRQRERRQEHLSANQPVSLGVARSERRNATPSSRRRVDGVQVIMIQPRDAEREAPRNLICALKKTIAAGSPPAGACSASNTMSDVPSVLVNMRSRPDVSQFVRSTAETTAERSAVGPPTLRPPTLRAGAARGAMRCSAQATPANAARRTTLIDTRYSAGWLKAVDKSAGRLAARKLDLL